MNSNHPHRPRQGGLALAILAAAAGLSASYGFPDFDGPSYRGPVSDPTPPVNPKDPEAAMSAAEAKRRRKQEKRERDARRSEEGRRK